MGDKHRFSAFALYLSQNFDKNLKVCDAAGGKGYLQQALRKLGFVYIVTLDKRKGRKDRPNMRYQYRFLDPNVKDSYDLLVGMHPDEATDLIIAEASKKQIPFSIVPCCIKPSVTTFWGSSYIDWINHLKLYAQKLNFTVSEKLLKISGCKNIALTGFPPHYTL